MYLPHLRLYLAGVFSLLTCGCATERLRDNTVEVGSTTTDLLYEMTLSNIAMVRYYNGDDTDAFTTWNKKNDVLDIKKLDDKHPVQVTIPTTGTPSNNGNSGEKSLADTSLEVPNGTKGAQKAANGQIHAELKDTPGNVLPWAYDISSGTVAVNDSIAVTPGLNMDMSTAHVFHPSLSLPMSRALQQSWGVTPVTDTIALNQLKMYYYRASIAKYTESGKTNDLIYRNGEPPTGCLKGSYRDKWVWIPVHDPEAMGNLTHLTQKIMAAIEDADQRAGARKTGNAPPDTTPFFNLR